MILHRVGILLLQYLEIITASLAPQPDLLFTFTEIDLLSYSSVDFVDFFQQSLSEFHVKS